MKGPHHDLADYRTDHRSARRSFRDSALSYGGGLAVWSLEVLSVVAFVLCIAVWADWLSR